jgi:hypothetical protein
MGNNVHFLAVDIATLTTQEIEPGDFLGLEGLSWCGDSWERSWAFHDQLETVIAPLLRPELLQVITGEVQSFTHPLVEAMRADGVEVHPMTPREFGELRAVASQAVAAGSWGSYDDREWRALAAADATGDFFIRVEFV